MKQISSYANHIPTPQSTGKKFCRQPTSQPSYEWGDQGEEVADNVVKGYAKKEEIKLKCL